jgi:hypothetical protein
VVEVEVVALAPLPEEVHSQALQDQQLYQVQEPAQLL